MLTQNINRSILITLSNWQPVNIFHLRVDVSLKLPVIYVKTQRVLSLEQRQNWLMVAAGTAPAWKLDPFFCSGLKQNTITCELLSRQGASSVSFGNMTCCAEVWAHRACLKTASVFTNPTGPLSVRFNLTVNCEFMKRACLGITNFGIISWEMHQRKCDSTVWGMLFCNTISAVETDTVWWTTMWYSPEDKSSSSEYQSP